MSERLKKRTAEHVTRVEFLDTLWYESARAGLEPSLMLGVVQVESGFRKYAISVAGARGYTQVMPFWVRLIGDGDSWSPVPYPDQLAIRLRDPAPLSRHGAWRPLSRARTLQREPWSVRNIRTPCSARARLGNTKPAELARYNPFQDFGTAAPTAQQRQRASRRYRRRGRRSSAGDDRTPAVAERRCRPFR